MTPADEKAPPVLWLSAERRFQALLPPAPPSGWPTGTRGVVVAVGAFDEGLAPAQVRWQVPAAANPPAQVPISGWGFVDAQGRWAIAPQFREAKGFVGPVALVMAEGPVLIDRQGRRLPWTPKTERQGRELGLSQFVVRRAGPHATVLQSGAWVPHPDQPQRQVALAHAIVKGRVQQVPGDVGLVDPTGSLWQLAHNEGLWSPDRGVIARPESATAVWPVAADLMAVEPGPAPGVELRRLDGSVVVRGLSSAFAIDASHIGACTVGGWSPPRDTREQDMRRWQAKLRDARCGVMNTQGRWLHPPTAQWLTLEGPWLRLQSPAGLCEFDLREAAGPCRAVALPAPELEMPPSDTETERLFAFRGAGAAALAQLRLDAASRFTGQVAAVRRDGVTGAVDREGRWLTPRPSGTLVQRMTEGFAAGLQVNGRATGWGVVDNTGRFVLPPHFTHLVPLDGTGLMQMCGDRPYVIACPSIDVAGRIVPASATPAAAAPAPRVLSGEPHPEGLNGLWGYRDARGRWVIEPRFALADPFDGDVAIVAMAAPGEEERQLWGVIDRKGQWLVEAAAMQIERLSPGLFSVGSPGDFRVVDTRGQPVSGQRFETITPLAAGGAIAVTDQRQPCVMDGAGRCPLLPGVKQLTRLDGGPGTPSTVAAERDENGSRLWGVLDAQSRWLIPPRFSSVARVDAGHLLVSVDFPNALAGVQANLPHGGIATQVQALHEAGVLLVTLATPAGPRMALLLGDGQWLLSPVPGR